MTGVSDAALVRRAQAGDHRAFEALYRARAAAVFRYARSIVGGREAAEDVTAQTFLRAWEKLDSVRDATRFDAWLFRIAHNAALNECRRQSPIPLEQAPESADECPAIDPERRALSAADGAAVRDALGALGEDQRTVVALRAFGRLSFREIGEQTGRSEQAARVTHHRALKRMRDALVEVGYVPDTVPV